MAQYTSLINNFSAGEVSPRLNGRIDFPQYQAGCAELENFFVSKAGGIERRPGTVFVAETPSLSRLVSFRDKDGDDYILTFMEDKIWVANESGYVVDSNDPGKTYEITTTYKEEDLFELRFATVGEELWIVHQGYEPKKLYPDSGPDDWAFSAITFTDNKFQNTGDWPGAIGVYGGRVYLGGTENHPHYVWASRTPEAASGNTRFTDFTLGAQADDGLLAVQNEIRGYRVLWIEPHRLLTCGTERGEMAVGTDLPTPATFNLRVHASNGCSNVQARSIGLGVVYVRRGGTRAGLLTYSEEAGGMRSVDITSHADHILEPGVTDMAVQNYPEPVVWFVRSDGVGVVLTLDAESGVLAFSRVILGGEGEIKSVVVECSTDTDRVWVSVKRGNKYYVEYFSKRGDRPLDEACYVDCAVIGSQAPSETVSGLTHLEGEEVTGLGDGSILVPKEVSGGEVEYDRAISKYSIGYSYPSRMKTLRVLLPVGAGGFGKKRRVEKVTSLFYRTLGGLIGSVDGSLERILYRDDKNWEEPLPLFTGEKEKTFAGRVDTIGEIIIEQDQPYPMNILALSPRIAVLEV